MYQFVDIRAGRIPFVKPNKKTIILNMNPTRRHLSWNLSKTTLRIKQNFGSKKARLTSQ